MKEIAPDVRHFVTTQPTDELVPDVNNWIALINKYDKDYAQERQAAGDHVWWYTSVNPKHPFPSYHIDDELLSARLLSWMQKDYGVEGNLFWSTTIFKKYDGKQYVPRDVWTDPLAFPGANGDGYLFYPGTQLGIDGPVGTIRLEAIREGMEDYEYLWQLEQHIKETASRLGVKDYPVHDSLQFYYDRLYKNIRSFADDPANLLDVRADVAEEITSTDKGPLALVGVTGTGGIRQLTIHTEPGAEVRLGDRVLAPSEKGASYDKFTAEIAVHNGPNKAVLTITRDGVSRTLTKIIQVNGEEPTVPVVFQDAETPADLQKLTSSTVNLSLSDEYATNGQHSLKAEFKGE
ncbi:DUF4091 domain-containing protein [Paenibacillus sp. CC-CFT747]|nr:DUF4091 domain-containing protein [Paenibacillus sp. CC-CFT747]